MTTTITGAGGVSQVQAGAIEHGDLPSGSVLQVVNAANNTTRLTTTNVYIDVFGANASITPIVTGSRVFASITIGGISRLSNTATTTSFIITDGNSTEIKSMSNHYLYRASVDAGGSHRSNAHWFVDLGTSTTAGSAKTFNIQFKNNNGSDSVAVTYDAGDYTNITLWEVAQ